LQFNTTGRAINAKVKKGTFASSPVAPTLQRDADAYELALADVYVGAGVTSIAGANITDQRMNTALCGWVNSLIQADTTAIFNQYQAWFTAQSGTYNTQMVANETQFQADFTTWFNSIKGQLSGDIATNLANQITTLEGTGWTTETVKGNATALAAHQADYMPHDDKMNSYASSIDVNGIYTVVDFKRADATLYLKSTLSNTDASGNYQTVTWKFYDAAGTTIKLTLIWTLTYNTNGVISQKVVA
jgi:hypothetical protein